MWHIHSFHERTPRFARQAYLRMVCATAEMMREPPLAPTTIRSAPSCRPIRGLMELSGFFPGLARKGR